MSLVDYKRLSLEVWPFGDSVISYYLDVGVHPYYSQAAPEASNKPTAFIVKHLQVPSVMLQRTEFKLRRCGQCLRDQMPKPNEDHW
jgi:hypothetical protein